MKVHLLWLDWQDSTELKGVYATDPLAQRAKVKLIGRSAAGQSHKIYGEQLHVEEWEVTGR